MQTSRKSSIPPQALEDMEHAIRLGPTTSVLYRDAALLYTQTVSDRLQGVPVSLDTPIVTAFHLWACEQQVDRTFSYLRRAIAEGQTPASITKNYYFQRAWQSHPAFADFHQLQPQRAPRPMELQLIDPIDLLP